jgi:hypothetical protein
VSGHQLLDGMNARREQAGRASVVSLGNVDRVENGLELLREHRPEPECGVGRLPQVDWAEHAPKPIHP